MGGLIVRWRYGFLGLQRGGRLFRVLKDSGMGS
jgi:hypothetical protein